MFADVSPDDVRRAAEALRGLVKRTPLQRARALSARLATDAWLKLENAQETGSFKLRGATNALLALGPNERSRGVVTASAGNHGRGLAFAARRLGVPVTVYVPVTAPTVKLDGMRACGATVDTSAAHYDEAHRLALRHAREHGVPFIDPCSGVPLVAGQGTVALEIFEELPDVRTLVVPVGGAGLLGGIAAYTRATSPRVRIVGVQTENTDVMARSLDAGHIVERPMLPTLADGLAGSIDEHGFDVGRHAIDSMVVVTEANVADAMRFLAREESVVAEGSGAVGVAALLSHAVPDLRGPVAVIVSGGNVDPQTLDRVLA